MLTDIKADVKAEEDSFHKYKELVAEAEKHLTKATAKWGDRRKAIGLMDKYIANLKKSDSLSPSDEATARGMLTDVNSTLALTATIKPDTGSLFVRFFLGQVNVKVSSSKDAARLRDEYEKFKDRTNLGFIIFPLLWLLTTHYLSQVFAYTDWIFTLSHIWLLYYYVSLSLRENILRVNGSSIRPWWITHHYISGIMSMIVLTWPSDSKTWNHFLPQFTAFFLYQGIVQLTQAAYQKQRHYALRALGKAGSMDVAQTEGFSEFHPGLYFVVGLVIIAQGWQIFNGLSLLRILFFQMDHAVGWYNYREEIQVFALAMLFLVLGSMNFINVIQTLLDKGRRQRQRRIARVDASGKTE